MDEIRRKNMMALNDDEMSAVSGGIGVLEGLPSDARDNAMRVRARSMGAGAGNGVPGGTEAPLVKTGGSADSREYVKIFCPFCKINTDHLTYSGGRVECTICHTIHNG